MSGATRSGRARGRSGLDNALFAVTLAALLLVIAYPTVRLLVQAIANWRIDVLTEGAGRAAIRNTILISFLSVFTSALVGTGLAFLLTRFSFPGSRVLGGLAYLPFTLPPLVGVVAFYYIFGRDGFVPRAAHQWFGAKGWYLEGPGAILLIHTYSFYVFFYAMVSAAIETLDASQIEAARTLGASRWRVFSRVTLPQLRPALLGAALLTFMSSGASFSAPLIFGNDYPMLSVRIYEAQSQHREAEAMTMTVALASISLLGVLVFRSRLRAGGVASKGTRVPLRSRSGRLLAAIGGFLCIAVVLIPHLTIVWLSFVDHREWYSEVIPRVFTLENYASIFRDATAFRPIKNSLWMSAVAALCATFLALPIGYLHARRRRGGKLVNVLVMVPWALPGTVIAINLIVAFNDPWLPLAGTVVLLPLAYCVRGLPLLSRMTSAAIEPFDASLIAAGRTLGASRTRCFMRIVIPLLAPAVFSGAALVFSTSLGEFVASILLWVPANMPISVQINEAWRGSGIGAAFAYSVFLMLLVSATYIATRRFASRVV